MGQYFKVINLDKNEYVMDNFKLWEIVANHDLDMLGILLRRSNEGGGGDYPLGLHPLEGDYLGRWAGDRIAIVGDYDESELYDSEDLVNITVTVREITEAFRKW